MKKIYAYILMLMTKLFGIDNTKKFDAYLRFRRKLNMKTPKSLADKVCYIELHEDNKLQTTCTDKYAVRDYIKSKGMEEILIPVVGGPWESVDEEDIKKLPSTFVLKATHGCKMNYVVLDKEKLNKEECYKEMQRWMCTTYGTYSMEPHYTKIPHRIYAEEYLEDMSGLIDYKFHCLNGEPKFILTVTDRKVCGDQAMQATLDVFDIDWKYIDAVVGANAEKAGSGKVPKPKMLKKMIEISRELSKDFKFVRVDLYELDEKIYFGELTFSPACCVFPYLKQNFLDEMGRQLSI